METILSNIPFGPIQMAEVNQLKGLEKNAQPMCNSIFGIITIITIGVGIIIVHDVIQRRNLARSKSDSAI